MFPRFYPILDVDVAAARGLDPITVCQIWLDEGVRLFQLRAKQMAGGAMLELASTCVRLARPVGALCIVNDRADVARLVGAAGVHLGQDDLLPADARLALTPGSMVGWSTHNEAQVLGAANMPIDYLAIGPVFDTQSKLKPDPIVGLDGVRRAVALAGGRPVVAIGGITIANAADVLAAGAASVAVIGDVLHEDVRIHARRFLDRCGR